MANFVSHNKQQLHKEEHLEVGISSMSAISSQYLYQEFVSFYYQRMFYWHSQSTLLMNSGEQAKSPEHGILCSLSDQAQ